MRKILRSLKSTMHVRSGLSTRLKATALRWLKLLATYLTRQSEKVSVSTKKSIVVIFCLVFGVASFVIALNGFERKISTVYIERISIPSNVLHPPGQSMGTAGLASTRYTERIKRFRLYLDSLCLTPSGKATYDSISKARPGLIDSLALIDKFDLEYKNK